MASVLERKFYRAMLQLQTEKEVAAFFRDLLTLSEIDELSQRLEVATLLDQGKTQRVVAKLTDASIATVTRVNQWLKRGTGGYKLVLERLYNHRHQQHGKQFFDVGLKLPFGSDWQLFYILIPFLGRQLGLIKADCKFSHQKMIWISQT
ncbi:hypothetical protein KA517_01630 [Candidatus Gracilibacteria bacterium]|nr:hypothetical protein [Candidatus Gracilibacteria bacterium]